MKENGSNALLRSKFSEKTKNELIEFITMYQNRKFAEEVEFFEGKEGEVWI